MFKSNPFNVNSVIAGKVKCTNLVVKTEPAEYSLREFLEEKVEEFRIYVEGGQKYIDVYIPNPNAKGNLTRVMFVLANASISESNTNGEIIEYILNRQDLIKTL